MNKQDSLKKYRRTKKGILTNIYSKQKTRKGVNYSLKELHAMFLNNKKFDRLYKEWIKSNYNIQFKPTIDRINPKLGYTQDNIHCLTWAENRYKQRMEMKFTRARKVCQMMGNKIIKTFSSQRIAVKETGLSQGNMSMCLTGKRKTTGGYGWKYFDTIEVIGNIHDKELL